MQELQACDLFINIPFTTRAVDALDTNCYANTPPAVKRAYLQAVLAEMEGFSEEARELAVTSVTLGGGSASTLPADDLRRLLRGIARAFDTPRDVPVFATFDPGLLSIGQALELKAFGSPRIDLRYFTSDAREANLLGCPAPETETKKTDIVLEHAGIADIGMHVALGMVGQSEESLLKTLRAARRSSVKRFCIRLLFCPATRLLPAMTTPPSSTTARARGSSSTASSAKGRFVSPSKEPRIRWKKTGTQTPCRHETTRCCRSVPARFRVQAASCGQTLAILTGTSRTAPTRKQLPHASLCSTTWREYSATSSPRCIEANRSHSMPNGTNEQSKTTCSNARLTRTRPSSSCPARGACATARHSSR